MFKQLVSKIFYSNGGVDTAVSDVNNLPVQDASLAIEFSSKFSQILERRFKDTEEVRYAIPTANTLPGNSIYIGVAPDASLTTDLVWDVVRFYFDANGLPVRARIRKGIAWDSRTIGW